MLSGKLTLFKPKPKLDGLPFELIAYIATFLENDHDVISLYLTKKEFLQRINRFASLHKMRLPHELYDKPIYLRDVSKLLLQAYLHPEKMIEHVSNKKISLINKNTVIFHLLLLITYVILFPRLIDNLSFTEIRDFILTFILMKGMIDTHDQIENCIKVERSFANEGIISVCEENFIPNMVWSKREQQDEVKDVDVSCKM